MRYTARGPHLTHFASARRPASERRRRAGQAYGGRVDHNPLSAAIGARVEALRGDSFRRGCRHPEIPLASASKFVSYVAATSIESDWTGTTRSITLIRLSRVDDDGKVLIPPEIRRTMGVVAGDTVRFENGSQGVYVRAAKSAARFSKYRGIGNPGIPTGREGIVGWCRKSRGR